MAKAKKKKQTKKKVSVKDQAIRLCLLLLIPALALVVLLQWGLVGSFLYGLLYELFGPLTWVWILALGLGVPAYLVGYRFDKSKLRYYMAALLIFLATTLWLQLGSTKGFLSMGLLSVTKALIGQAGVYLLIGLAYLFAGILVFYEYLPKEMPKFDFKHKQPPELVEEPVYEAKEQPELLLPVDEPVEDLNIFDVPEPQIQPEVVEQKAVPQNKPDVVEESIDIPVSADYSKYKLPNANLLNPVQKSNANKNNANHAKQMGNKLIAILHEFGVPATLVDIHVGPAVTKFEVKPANGVRVNRISNLQYDLKMGLAAKELRIEAPIPGKNAVGIEVPNVAKSMVQMKELVAGMPSKLTSFALGKDLLGNNIYGQLDKMPHLLIAGSTGSGKSVCVNAIICSLLLSSRPDEVKLILIDPKKVEFTPYKDVPHLLAPVITDGEMANKALKVVVRLMDERYALFSEFGVRNIDGYNHYVASHRDEDLATLPRIIVIIDELADLMLVAAKEVEASIQRITQLARAAGIVLIVATQRPSVDVITGVIKANIPSRIAFAVSQAVDSRTILDQAGAERLLGNGDMLYLPNGQNSPLRIQGVFIQDEEVAKIASACKNQAKPQYEDSFITLADIASQGGMVEEASDPLYEDVKAFVIQNRRASTSLLQRRFSIGYSRAARLIDILEMQGIIGPAQGSKPRQVLVKPPVEGHNGC